MLFNTHFDNSTPHNNSAICDNCFALNINKSDVRASDNVNNIYDVTTLPAFARCSIRARWALRAATVGNRPMRRCANCEVIIIASKGSLLISISEGEIWTWLEKPTKHSSHENADKQSPVVHRRCGWLSQQSGDVRLDGRVTGAQSKWYWLQTPYLRETAHEQKRFHHVTQRCGVSTVDMRHGCCGS